MNTMNPEAREEIEALLPWHAAGTLSRNDAEKVERALRSDRELARRFDLVREELHETIHLNELLGHPSPRAAEKLFAAIDAEGASRQTPRSFDLAGKVAAFLASLTPKTLAYSAGAAVVALLVQGAVLTSVLLKDQTGGDELGYGLASSGSPAESDRVVVRFSPQATSADINLFLRSHNAEVVSGPKDGNFTLRVSPIDGAKDGVLGVVREMQGDNKVVDFVAAKGAKE